MLNAEAGLVRHSLGTYSISNGVVLVLGSIPAKEIAKLQSIISLIRKIATNSLFPPSIYVRCLKEDPGPMKLDFINGI